MIINISATFIAALRKDTQSLVPPFYTSSCTEKIVGVIPRNYNSTKPRKISVYKKRLLRSVRQYILANNSLYPAIGM